MDHDAIEALQERHAAWRLLGARNAPLVLTFLGTHFVEEYRGATASSGLTAALDDLLFELNTDPDEPRYPRPPQAYLDEWAASNWLRRFYPAGADEVHYDALPALERAYSWVTELRSRSFVGTESRLHTVFELLRQIVHGADPDPDARLAQLHRRRADLEREIVQAEAGSVEVLDTAALRDRYQQFAGTARSLLSDFREVEENFRMLDRSSRERIASWEGSKGDLLAGLVLSRADIAGSDQGRSFQAFYDLLLSEERQDELSDLLSRVSTLHELEPDMRLARIHYDWSDAAERTQQTVRQISEQLRRFLDDQVWLENRRVLDLMRRIEAAALACRDDPPSEARLEFDEASVAVTLPMERPLYDARPPSLLDSVLDPEVAAEVDVTALFAQTFVDQARLAEQVRSVVPRRGSVLLGDIIAMFPLEQGAAELIGYLALGDDDIDVVLDEDAETIVDIGGDTEPRRIRMPQATVTRR